jgi:hypothetical protein
MDGLKSAAQRTAGNGINPHVRHVINPGLLVLPVSQAKHLCTQNFQVNFNFWPTWHGSPNVLRYGMLAPVLFSRKPATRNNYLCAPSTIISSSTILGELIHGNQKLSSAYILVVCCTMQAALKR